ncbi:MAG: GTPase ObgE [Anaerolineales bacterium]
MIYDQVKIYVQAGKGGDGAVAFRREKYIPYGGPSGGDGGRGGDVILEVSEHRNTLYHFAHQKDFKAEDGVNGRNKDMHGAGGDPLIIKVPPGTLVFDAETGELLTDLKEKDEQFVAAQGGRGGRGNARFATSTNQAPRIAERGDPGEERWLKLELKLLADVGLVGKPNAGKSTLISVTTAAKPEIAPYPFTTLQPNLGVVALNVNQTFVLADLPGLIAGASEGKGLGLEFLRHIERTRVIIHLLDGNALDPIADFQEINAELAAFGHGLMQKPQIVAVNKMDIPGVEDIFPIIKEEIEARGYKDVLLISALAHQNTRELMGRAHQKLQEAPMPQIHRPMPAIIRPKPEELGYTISREASDLWRVRGDQVELMVHRTPTHLRDALMRLHKYLDRQGILKALREAGVAEGDTVRIGDFEFEWREEIG